MIDDDAVLLDMLQEEVEASGHLVLKATNPDQAVRLFRDTEPELVIMDVIMPGFDGLELLRQFKEMRPGFKSIVLSGLNNEDLKANARKCGADYYLVKPVRIEDFRSMIENLLSR